jgi:hypothetical protein
MLIRRIEDMIFLNYNVTSINFKDEDIKAIKYMILGKVEYQLDKITDDIISYMIDTYFDNKDIDI